MHQGVVGQRARERHNSRTQPIRERDLRSAAKAASCACEELLRRRRRTVYVRVPSGSASSSCFPMAAATFFASVDFSFTVPAELRAVVLA